MTSPVAALPQIGRSWKTQIVNATGASTLVTVATPNASYTFAKITSFIATNDDGSNARVVQWGITRGGVWYPIASINVPLNAGFASGVNAVNLLDPTVAIGLPLDADGQPYIFLEQAGGDTLQAQVTTQVTSAKHINLIAAGGEY